MTRYILSVTLYRDVSLTKNNCMKQPLTCIHAQLLYIAAQMACSGYAATGAPVNAQVYPSKPAYTPANIKAIYLELVKEFEQVL